MVFLHFFILGNSADDLEIVYQLHIESLAVYVDIDYKVPVFIMNSFCLSRSLLKPIFYLGF